MSADASLNVYWDPECTRIVSSIDWGTVFPRSSRSVAVFIRNEGYERVYLKIWLKDWTPSNAYNVLDVRWAYDGGALAVDNPVKIVFTLDVKAYVYWISDFSFNIVIETSEYSVGDVNRNGQVDLQDVFTVILAYESTPESANWNPDADLNENLWIDPQDIDIAVLSFGQDG